MTVADNVVDRPLVDLVSGAIGEDHNVANEVKCDVLAALEGPTALQELLDGISTPHVAETSGERTVDPRQLIRDKLTVEGSTPEMVVGSLAVKLKLTARAVVVGAARTNCSASTERRL